MTDPPVEPIPRFRCQKGHRSTLTARSRPPAPNDGYPTSRFPAQRRSLVGRDGKARSISSPSVIGLAQDAISHVMLTGQWESSFTWQSKQNILCSPCGGVQGAGAWDLSASEPKTTHHGGGWRATGLVQAHAWTSVNRPCSGELRSAETLDTRGKRRELDGLKLPEACSPSGGGSFANSGPSQSSFDLEVAGAGCDEDRTPCSWRRAHC